MTWTLTVGDWLQDLKHAARSLRRTPGFTAAAMLTLALGIGTNTAIFSLLDAVLWRVLPIASPQQLYFIGSGSAAATADLHAIERPSLFSNYPWFERIRQRTDVFAAVTAYNTRTFKVSSGSGVDQVVGQYVSGNYHAVLGVPFVLGRGFANEDDRAAGSTLVAVISEDYWTRRFDRRPDVVGRTITVGGRPLTILGVTAGSFDGMDPGQRIDVTLPLSIRIADEPDFVSAHDTWTSMPLVARLKTGVTHAHAAAAVETTYRQFMSEPENRRFSTTPDGQLRTSALIPASRGQDDLRVDYSTALRLLTVMVGVVLLLVCINIANLLLVRAHARVQEVAVRVSVGASRWRVARHTLAESLILASCGAALGLLLAAWTTDIVALLLSQGQNPIVLDAQPNGTVLLFTTGLAVLTAVAFGIVPAVCATRIEAAPMLRAPGSREAAPAAMTTRKILVGAQIALSLVLVFGAVLLVRTLWNLEHVDGGFRKDNVLVFTLDSRDTRFPERRMVPLCTDVLDGLRGHAGVRSASCSTMSPVDTSFEIRRLGMPRLPSGEIGDVHANTVTPDYFRTFGIALVRGRGFADTDRNGAPRVAVVNEAMARAYFAGADPIGHAIGFGSAPDRLITIVGVVRDARQQLREDPPRMVYTPLAQIVEPPKDLLGAVMTDGPTTMLAPVVRGVVSGLTREVAVTYVRTMRQQISASLVGERLVAGLASAFGGLALVLACVGLYGVMSYDIARRTRDIGIRMALGAHPAAVLSAVLREVGVIAGIGLSLGLVGAALVSGLVTDLLFGLTSRDPLTLAITTAVLGLTALLAGYFPARRAARVNPAVALRGE